MIKRALLLNLAIVAIIALSPRWPYNAAWAHQPWSCQLVGLVCLALAGVLYAALLGVF
jgi:hypothetical protein